MFICVNTCALNYLQMSGGPTVLRQAKRLIRDRLFRLRPLPKWGLAAIVLFVLLSSATSKAQYEGTVGGRVAKARLTFTNDTVFGHLCIEHDGVSLRKQLYELRANNPPGRIDGNLLQGARTVGSIHATKEIKQDKIIWRGAIQVNQLSERFLLYRSKDTNDSAAPLFESEFDESDMSAGVLDVIVATPQYDEALTFLRTTNLIIGFSSNDSDADFAYETYIDDCTRSFRDWIKLRLEVDPFKMKEAFRLIVSSKGILEVRTVRVADGPRSMSVTIPQEAFGQKPSEAIISEFLDLLLEKYFNHFVTKDAHCTKYEGATITDYLSSLPDRSDHLMISPLETNKFCWRRAVISGLSRNLSVRPKTF